MGNLELAQHWDLPEQIHNAQHCFLAHQESIGIVLKKMGFWVEAGRIILEL